MSEEKGFARDNRKATSPMGRYPLLRRKLPNAGDRARFHFLASGTDDLQYLASFHRFGSGSDFRQAVCLRSMDLDSCVYCSEGHTDVQKQFAFWVYVYYVLHSTDNPDEKGAKWKQVKVGSGDAARTMFQEKLGESGEGEPMLIWLPGGRKMAWFSQFSNAFTTHGNLQTHLYDIRRVGTGRDDTNWILSTVKEEPLPKAIAEKIVEWRKAGTVVDVPNVFKETLGFGPATSGTSATGEEDSVEEVDAEEGEKAAGPQGGEDDLEELPIAVEDEGDEIM